MLWSATEYSLMKPPVIVYLFLIHLNHSPKRLEGDAVIHTAFVASKTHFEIQLLSYMYVLLLCF